MATTMKLIAKNTLGSTSASIDFSSIPSTYDDLLLVLSGRNDFSGAVTREAWLRMNNDSGASAYSYRYLDGSGSAASSGSATTTRGYIGQWTAATATASTFASIEVYIPNYAGATNKSYSATSAMETNATTAYITATAGLWSSTAAISQLTILSNSGSLVSGTSAYLYGISKA